jgi:hypothetical protein
MEALATADALFRQQERSIWVSDDIADAFGTVPLRRLLQVVRKHIPAPQVVDLVDRIIEPSRSKGLRQGSALSPLLTNLYLDHFLDRPWRALHPQIPLLRYVDDLLVLCRPDEEPVNIYADLVRLVRDAGLSLKADPARVVQNAAAGQAVSWLGFSLSASEEGIRFGLPVDGPGGISTRLRALISDAHALPASPLRAAASVNGMLSAAGPTYEYSDRKRVFQLILAIGQELAFEELPSPESLDAVWRAAHARWCRIRERVAGELNQTSCRLSRSASQLMPNSGPDEAFDQIAFGVPDVFDARDTPAPTADELPFA